RSGSYGHDGQFWMGAEVGLGLQMFSHPEGYVERNGSEYDYVYQYKDHLGNIRLTYMDNNGSLDIIEEHNYYPFGGLHKGYNDVVSANVNSVAQKYGFNGQPYEESLGLNVQEMTFRHYEPNLGRFFGIDPAAEMAHNWTPYRFGFNNPILFSDPTGLWERTADGSWTTNDTKDIERFMNMLGFEELNNGEKASIAQIDIFISEEFNGTGGRLSDGSILLDEETIVTGRNGNSNGFSARQANNIKGQVENYGSNPWNEKSAFYSDLFYSYKYFRERSWHQNGSSFPGVKLGFFAGKYAQNLLYNPGNWWFSTKTKKFYDWKFNGNGYTGGRDGYIGKLSKKYSSIAGNAGKLVGVYGLYSTYGEYAEGNLTALGASYIGGVDGGAIASKNIYVAGWSLGTGIGKSIVESNLYFNTFQNAANW
ncbi:RHS repeat-associated core domain-containing protein, partial [Winogradskyella sp.]|uniref:RHS repeat domain-containing protein n=1 Tax=Winogradskyella sp. TaxID=1883156 RepID=UPI0026384560